MLIILFNQISKIGDIYNISYFIHHSSVAKHQIMQWTLSHVTKNGKITHYIKAFTCPVRCFSLRQILTRQYCTCNENVIGNFRPHLEPGLGNILLAMKMSSEISDHIWNPDLAIFHLQ